jgi:hypothetical protein
VTPPPGRVGLNAFVWRIRMHLADEQNNTPAGDPAGRRVVILLTAGVANL